MKCYASDYCQKDKSSCSDVCGGYRVLRALYNLSRIPERYRYTIALKPENGEDLEALYKEQERIEKALEIIDRHIIEGLVYATYEDGLIVKDLIWAYNFRH